MRELAYDEEAHLAKADYMRKQEEYVGALEESKLAIIFAPYDAEALNTNAYITWQWYWYPLQYKNVTGPSWGDLTDAVANSQTAVHLTEDKGVRRDHGVYQSSLGELQLARGNFTRAYDTLHEIFFPDKLLDGTSRPADVGNQPLYDEMRWDLAQAATCASLGKGATAEQRALAKEYLDTIHQHEKTREDQRFVGMLTIPTLQENCREFRNAALSAWRESEESSGGGAAAK